MHAHLNYSLFIVPRGPGKHTHIFTHTPQIDQRHHKAKTDTLRSTWRQKETTCSQTRTLLGTITHTHSDTSTEPETQRPQVNMGAGRHADASTYRNTNTALYLGTRVPLTSPQHTQALTQLKQTYTRSPSCAAPLRAMRPLRASCRSQAEAPAALEPSWCQHCHHVATGAQCTGRRLECRPVGMKLRSSEVSPPNLGLFV